MYAKVLLYEQRLNHQEERVALLKNNDIKGYAQLLFNQIQVELQSFINAQDTVT